MARTICIAAFTLFALSLRIANADSPAAQRPVVDAASHIDRALPDAGIQRAIDAAAEHEGGAVVQLPAGTFELSAYLFLRSGVTIKGHGEQTILKLVTDELRRTVAAPAAGGATRITLEGDLSALKPGTLIHVWRNGASTHNVHMRNHIVKAVEGQDVVLDGPYSFALQMATKPHVSWGRSSRIVDAVESGATSVRVLHPEMFKVGHAVTFSGEGNMWGHYYGLVTAVEGQNVTLDRVVDMKVKADSTIHLAHCMITADGQTHIGVESLAIRGFADERGSPWGGFTLGAIHTTKTTHITIRNVSVHDWNGDAFSIQGGEHAAVENCQALRNAGHGFHPGTRFLDANFTNLVSTHNTGDGFYYCWHNNRVHVRKSILSDNGSYGVGGLGNPGDRNNIVEDNTIERNGRAGIYMGGGPNSGNTVRNNIIRDNSAAKPGEWPGILITAIPSEPSSGAIIEGNTIESTSESPTQWVGIEERHHEARANTKDKADPATGLLLADNNRFIANRLSNHRTADLILRGPNSKVEGEHGQVKEDRPTAKAD